jgi:hypothetical protein
VVFGLPHLGFPALNRGVPDLIAPYVMIATIADLKAGLYFGKLKEDARRVGK